ncbi:MAG: right-handed parallel beta-helix repeat-containing protein [Gemmatimonadaceae bacterium]|nr:right-handed parallel beta-helix repeat-containing protein [Gemmatimonadaceae bacterium]
MTRLRPLATALGVVTLAALVACDTSSPTDPGIDPAISESLDASLAVAPAAPRSWYVAPNGSDANPGTATLPFRTVQKGVNRAAASDTVVVQAGTYALTTGVLIQKKFGTPAAPFVLRGNGAAILRDPTGKSLLWSGLVNVKNSTNVVVTGLTLQNSGFFGVMIQSANRVTVQGVTSTTSGASALYALSSYNIKVYNNDFSNFCYLGAYGRGITCQEGISIVSVDTFDVAENLVHDARQTGSSVQPGGGEGIDVKEASKHGYVRYNKVWNLVQLGIYIDAWDKTLEDVEVAGNRVWNTAAGITIASEEGGTVRNVRVHDNLVYRNGYDGIEISGYGKNGLRENIAIYGNTTSYNGYTANKPPYCKLWGCGDYGTGIRVETTNIRNSRIHDNISYQNATTVMESAASATNAVIDNNVVYPVGKSTWAPEKLGSRPIKVDPLFVFPGSNDFHLRSTSPAIRRAIGGDPLNQDADRFTRSVHPTELGAFIYR